MHAALLVVRATIDDVAAIRPLTDNADARWVKLIGRAPMPMTADQTHAVIHHHIDLVHLDGRLAALIEMIPKNDHIVVESLAVAPAHRGSGLGSRLLAHAETVAASLGHHDVRLATNKLFAANLSFYGKRGYLLEREEAWSGGIVMHMRKRLGRAEP